MASNRTAVFIRMWLWLLAVVGLLVVDYILTGYYHGGSLCLWKVVCVILCIINDNII